MLYERPHHLRLDAPERAFFARELEFVDQQIYEIEYSDHRARSFIPTQQGVPEWARSYTWTMFDKFGKAKIIGPKSKDIPRVDVSGVQDSKVIKDLAAAYGWDMMEIKAARKTGRPIDSMRALAARFAIDAELDEILAVGNSAHNLEGLLNLSGIPTFTPGTKTGGGTAWSEQATPDEIAADLFNIVKERRTAIQQAGGPTFNSFTIILPQDQYTTISQRRMGDGSNVTILNFVLENSPFIESIEEWYRCAGAGAGSTDRMVCYPRNPLILAGIVPLEFSTMAPRREGLEFVVDVFASCGGVVVRYPGAMSYGDGI